jgi:hypothetical protein
VGLSLFHLWTTIPNTCSKSGIPRPTRREICGGRVRAPSLLVCICSAASSVLARG